MKKKYLMAILLVGINVKFFSQSFSIDKKSCAYDSLEEYQNLDVNSFCLHKSVPLLFNYKGFCDGKFDAFTFYSSLIKNQADKNPSFHIRYQYGYDYDLKCKKTMVEFKNYCINDSNVKAYINFKYTFFENEQLNFQLDSKYLTQKEYEILFQKYAINMKDFISQTVYGFLDEVNATNLVLDIIPRCFFDKSSACKEINSFTFSLTGKGNSLNEDALHVNFYPMPFSNELNAEVLSGENANNLEALNICVYNSLGENAFKAGLHDNLKINTENLPVGNYVIVIEHNGIELCAKSVVKIN